MVKLWNYKQNWGFLGPKFGTLFVNQVKSIPARQRWVPEFRVEEEQAAMSDMSIDIDYLK